MFDVNRGCIEIKDSELQDLAGYIGRLLTAHVDSYHTYHMVLTQWLVEYLDFCGYDAVTCKSVATGIDEKIFTRRVFESGPEIIEYFNICGFNPNIWKRVRGSAKVLRVKEMSVHAYDDNSWAMH